MKRRAVEIIVPEPLYAEFDVEGDDLPQIIVVNEAMLAFRHMEFFPWYMFVTINAHDVTPQRMPTAKEGRVLYAIAEAIETAILATRTSSGQPNAVPLGRRTYNGRHQLFFQVHDDDVACKALDDVEKSRPWPRTWDASLVDDEWYSAGCLFELFPRALGHDA